MPGAAPAGARTLEHLGGLAVYAAVKLSRARNAVSKTDGGISLLVLSGFSGFEVSADFCLTVLYEVLIDGPYDEFVRRGAQVLA